MPVIGAVIVLSPAAPVPDALRCDPTVTLGDRLGDHLPLVLTTARPREDRERLEQLSSMPGVLDLQVAFADFSDLLEVSP